MMIKQFLTNLNQKTTYIHWKSNVRLADALKGKTDLDLLIAPEDEMPWRQLAAQYDLKAMANASDRDDLALEHYLGFDAEAGDLAHLHVHYRLILGEQLVKNYDLPLEGPLLASRHPHLLDGVMVPSLEWELLLFVVRVLLKTRDRDMVKMALGKPAFPAMIKQELTYLTAQIDQERFNETLEVADAVIPREVVCDFLEQWRTNQMTARTLWEMRARLRQAFKPYQRMGRGRALWLYFTRLGHKRMPKNLRRGSGKKNITSGGLTIAFVGADGAGKSTITADTRRWLGWKLGIRRLYMGSKESGYITEVWHAFSRWTKRVNGRVQLLVGRESFLGRLSEQLYALGFSCHAVSLAYQRYQRHLEGRKAASEGLIILYDRYPLEPLHEAMDGPRVRRTFSYGWLRWWMEREEHYYNSIAWPDLLIALHVRPEVALARKPDHDPVRVTRKSQAIESLRQQFGERLVWIDGEKPLDEVKLEVRRAIWRAL